MLESEQNWQAVGKFIGPRAKYRRNDRKEEATADFRVEQDNPRQKELDGETGPLRKKKRSAM